jgi:alkanesulfonate monooxygenase SsuD/methylene tetrahydromethanopterin reductase-like flavin-dependent oxidoreductase (luciferase family)
MPNFDISPKRRLRVGIGDAPEGATRVRAVDLRALRQEGAVVREEQPNAVVVVDIDVVIADDARSARATFARVAGEPGDTLLYVGTPSGLAGLITDIHALGIADGAVLLPMVDEGILDLIYHQVLPSLSTGPMRSLTREPRPA